MILFMYRATGLHTSSAPAISPDDGPETPEEQYKAWLKAFRETESSELKKVLNLEERISQNLNSAISSIN